MRRAFLIVGTLLVFSFLEGCVSSYQVEILKVNEMIQDMEAIELDEPDHASDFPQSGIVVKNQTERTLLVIMRRKKEHVMSIAPGDTGSMALDPGMYRYKICEDEAADEPKTKAVFIELEGTRKIVEKCVFIYDVFTKKEVVGEKEFEKLRSR
ncbi:MAG: hypothetical protein ACWGSD_01215 [Thermodesulfobacteriota bacterium]